MTDADRRDRSPSMRALAAPAHRAAMRAGALLRLVAAAATVAALALAAGAGRAQSGGNGPIPTPACPASLVPGAHDYHGLSLTMCNFSGQDLTDANFANATLTAVMFFDTVLAGANFSNATFADSRNPAYPNDLSLATLVGAVFTGAKFNGLTYLSHARLGCTDFSGTDIGNGNAVFGDAPLQLGSDTSCRTKFVGATMNCEFVPQWPQLDLSDAKIGACSSQLTTVAGQPGHDFSNALLSGVVFDNLDLSGSKWTGAVLEFASFQGATLDGASGLNGTPSAPSKLGGAKFGKASVRNVDLSNAALNGADFTNADLTNSSLAASSLISIPPRFQVAGSFVGALLKNVTLANAKLGGVSFSYASFYGTYSGGTPGGACLPAGPKCSAPSGFTCQCATAAGADLTATDFSNAFLFGTDFGGGTSVTGTNFASAILVGANFSGAKFQVNNGTATSFANALLQGAQFDSNATLANVTLSGAFLDFGAATNGYVGNILNLALTADYTKFSNWKGSAKPCVQTTYGAFSSVPGTEQMKCPSGYNGQCGANSASPNANPNWNGGTAMVSNAVQGWYAADATYDPAPDPPLTTDCGNGTSIDPLWGASTVLSRRR